MMNVLPIDVVVPREVHMIQFADQHPGIFWGVGAAVAAAIILLTVLIRLRRKKGLR
jgi:hypothetical protein